MSRIDSQQAGVASFVQKAFDIISNQEHSQIIGWSINGKEFAIKNIEQFEAVILPQYFRHRNINSFIRQLNMYGFHKSRKEPTKNIFSHPFFVQDRMDLLSQVKRKIKMDEQYTPQKSKPLDKTQAKITTQIKQNPVEVRPQAPISSVCSILALKSSNHIEVHPPTSFKSFQISRSFIMDINMDACIRQREESVVHAESDNEDKLSIADEINRERRRFNNRTQGISIVRTINFLSEFDL